MSIDFNRTFGQGNKVTPIGAANERQKAQFWLNIGYVSNVKDEETGEYKFVSLPLGIPLDTQEHLATNSKNLGFAQFQAARNDLLDQLMEGAKGLNPGESAIVACGENGLAIQIRRVNEEQGEVDKESNPYIRPLFAAPKAG